MILFIRAVRLGLVILNVYSTLYWLLSYSILTNPKKGVHSTEPAEK